MLFSKRHTISGKDAVRHLIAIAALACLGLVLSCSQAMSSARHSSLNLDLSILAKSADGADLSSVRSAELTIKDADDLEVFHQLYTEPPTDNQVNVELPIQDGYQLDLVFTCRADNSDQDLTYKYSTSFDMPAEGLVTLDISAPVAVSVLNYFDGSNADALAAENQIWDGFTTANPGMLLVRKDLFNSQELKAYNTFVSEGAAANTLPDVLYIFPTGESQPLQDKTKVKDLAPLLGEEFLANFPAAVLDPKRQSAGFLAELPGNMTCTTTVYINKKLLEDNSLAIPESYAELQALVAPLYALGKKTIVMAHGKGDDWVYQSCLFSTIVGRMCGDDFIDGIKAGTKHFTDPEFAAALTMLQQFFMDGIIDAAPLDYNESIADFLAGNAAIMIDGDWRVTSMLSASWQGIPVDKQDSDYAIGTLVTLPAEVNPGVVSMIVGNGFGINAAVPAGSAREKAAVNLIKYLYSPEVQKIRLEAGAFVPVRIDVTSTEIEPLVDKMLSYHGDLTKFCYVLDQVFYGEVVDAINSGLIGIQQETKTIAQVAASIQAAWDTQQGL